MNYKKYAQKSAKWKTFLSIKSDDILISFAFIAFYNTTSFKVSSHVLMWHQGQFAILPFACKCSLYAILEDQTFFW